MQLGIFAKTFHGNDPDAVLGAVAAAGYASAQYNLACSGLPSMPDRALEGTADAILAASARHGVTVAALSGTFNMVHPDVAERARGLARLQVVAAIGAKLPGKLVTLCTGTRDPADMWRAHGDNASPETMADLRKSMETAIRIAEEHDIRLGIEPETGNVIANARIARRFLDEMASERLAIVIDPANLFEHASLSERRALVSEAIDLLADRIILAHAKDRDASGAAVAPGKGVIDFAHYAAALKRAGFDGPLITHGLVAQEALAVCRHLAATFSAAGFKLEHHA
jgi:sugar phosphate isomerase/epimerase